MKTINLCFFSLLAVAGCDGSDAPAPPEADLPVPLAFSATIPDGQQSGTRADGITTANISSMGVFASYTGQGDWNDSYGTGSPLNYMCNESLSRTGSGPWTYSPVKYWPNTAGDKISFFAYAPHTDRMKAGALTVPAATEKGQLSFCYVTPAAAEDQTDLLIAAPVLNRTKTAGAVAFSFSHLVAKIIFNVKSSTPIRVQTIEMSNVTSAAYFWLDESGFSWDEMQLDSYPYIATINQNISADTSTEVATFFHLPTLTQADNPIYGLDSTVKLTYIQDSNVETLEAPLPKGWKEGDALVFTLVLDRTKIDVTVTGGSGMTWGDGGEAAPNTGGSI